MVCWHLEHNKSPDVLSAWQIRLARNYLLTFALVKKIFPLLCLPDFLEIFIVVLFLPDETIEQGRNASQLLICNL